MSDEELFTRLLMMYGKYPGERFDYTAIAFDIASRRNYSTSVLNTIATELARTQAEEHRSDVYVRFLVWQGVLE